MGVGHRVASRIVSRTIRIHDRARERGPHPGSYADIRREQHTLQLNARP
jgi:hypothetical protein